MWSCAYVASRYHSGYTFYDIEKTRGSGGKHTITGTSYVDLPLVFIPDDSRIIMRNSDGNIVNGLANAVVPGYWFESGNITPQIDDFIVTPAGVEYRVVGIDDFTHHTPAGIYYLFLQRDQLAFGRS